jgi:nitrate/TMAO reductase-like tetraheme cytochrome c subunit
MKRHTSVLLLLAPVAIIVLVAAGPAPKGTPVQAATDEKKPVPQYMGVKKCKMCHSSSKVGAQYKKWSAAAHSKAYQTLGGEEAKKIAAEKGIEDPQKSEKCLKCHVTGYGKDKKLFTKTFKMEDGVTCEACHGPASLWGNKKDTHAGHIDIAMKLGMVKPDEKTCRGCHNEESPSYKEFDFKKSWAKIAHSRPKKEEK